MVFGDKRGPKGPFAAAMNSYFPMPFGSGAVIKIINESESTIENLFYYIDYELTDEPLTDDVGRFHAQYNQENPCEKVVHDSDLVNPAPWDLPGINVTGDDNYVILVVCGIGKIKI